MHETLDLAIVGGGPAGMAAALVAGRARLDTVIVNEERPRNAVTLASHGFLTRDGAHPTELLAIAKQQLAAYPSVDYVVGRATAVRADGGEFVVEAGDRRWRSRRIILATGFRDRLDRLALPGVESVYGRSVFPCPFCDGFEHADERLAVFAGETAEQFVPVVRVWSEDLVVFTNGHRAPPSLARRVPVETARVARLHADDGRLRAVELEGGRTIERDAGFIGEDYARPATTFAADLGVPLATNAWGVETIEADASGQTSVAGVYVIGDARTGFGGLMASANEGSTCAAHIVHAVATERWSRLEVREPHPTGPA